MTRILCPLEPPVGAQVNLPPLVVRHPRAVFFEQGQRRDSAVLQSPGGLGDLHRAPQGIARLGMATEACQHHALRNQRLGEQRLLTAALKDADGFADDAFGFVEPALSQQDAGACLVHLRNAALVI